MSQRTPTKNNNRKTPQAPMKKPKSPKSPKNSVKRNLRDDLKQAGGRVSMPIQYFGGELNRYFPAGSPELNPLPSAYGTTIARSFGTYDPKLLQLNAVAPNLGPMGLGSHGENMSCGVQTGGKRKTKKNNKKQHKKKQQQTKKHNQTKGKKHNQNKGKKHNQTKGKKNKQNKGNNKK